MKRFNLMSGVMGNLTRGIRTHKATVFVYVLAVCLQIVMFFAFASEIIHAGGSALLKLFKYAGDCCLLLIPFWFVRPRWRWTILFPVLFVAAFCLVNLWYMRFWGDILPFSSMIMIQNIDGLLLNSIKGLLSVSDLWFLLPAVLMVFALVLLRSRLNREKIFSNHTKIVAVGCSLVLFLLSQAARTWSMTRWIAEEHRPSFVSVTKARLDAHQISPRLSVINNGIIVHLGMAVATALYTNEIMRPLSEKEKEEVFTFLSGRPGFQFNGVSVGNVGKNVILIIVESLNAEVIGRKVEGREITPTLNSLIGQKGTVSCLNMKSQIGEGGSSDGQLLYNTGLYPLSLGVTSLTVTPYAELHTLQSQLDRPISSAVFADSGSSWNQTLIFHKYGFDDVFTDADFLTDVVDRGADAAMFNHSLKLIDGYALPFFMELVTISMHVPFDDKGVHGYEWITTARNLGKVEADYLRMTAYFDAELGKFIDALKERHVYDNTILIIASDHSQQTKRVPQYGENDSHDSDSSIVFIAANTGITRRIGRKVGQIDVYPTILELAGVTDAEFRGLGVSMLDSVSSSFDERAEAQRVSDLILRGNYFGNR